MTTSDPELALHPDVQGLIFRGYTKLHHAAYGLFQITGRAACQAWIRGLLANHSVAAASDGDVPRGTIVNIAFTAPGMKALLAKDWIAASFGPSFVGGMVAEHRSRLLGDVGINDPSRWAWGANGQIDGLVIALATSKQEVDGFLDAVRPDDGVRIAHRIYGELNRPGFERNEPFGFADGISQPVILGSKRHRLLERTNPREAVLQGVPAGELVLGYPDGTGSLPRSPAINAASDPENRLEPHSEWPELRDLGRNGTYMVLRQLAQDVQGFWSYLEAAKAPGETAEELAAKMVGRHKDGSPLQPDSLTSADANNVFDFSDDPQGLHCPIGSHIRRTNPRATGMDDPEEALQVTNRHRILRRGRPYFDAQGAPAGLQFICFNASINRQFEFVQSAWANNPFFRGLQREVDPLIGTRPAPVGGLASVDRFTIPDRPYRRLLEGLPAFVTVKGGAYFFMPGLRALACLVHAPARI